MDILLSKDEKIEKLGRKIRSLEQRMEHNFSNVDRSIEMLRDIAIELQTENRGLRKDRDFLLSRYKEVLRRLETSASVGGIITPIKNEIKQTSSLIKEIVLEDMDAGSGKTGIDSLFELVMNKKRLTAEKAAKELGIDEKKVKYWALKLDKQGLIKIHDTAGKTVLAKI